MLVDPSNRTTKHIAMVKRFFQYLDVLVGTNGTHQYILYVSMYHMCRPDRPPFARRYRMLRLDTKGRPWQQVVGSTRRSAIQDHPISHIYPCINHPTRLVDIWLQNTSLVNEFITNKSSFRIRAADRRISKVPI